MPLFTRETWLPVRLCLLSTFLPDIIHSLLHPWRLVPGEPGKVHPALLCCAVQGHDKPGQRTDTFLASSCSPVLCVQFLSRAEVCARFVPNQEKLHTLSKVRQYSPLSPVAGLCPAWVVSLAGSCWQKALGLASTRSRPALYSSPPPSGRFWKLSQQSFHSINFTLKKEWEDVALGMGFVTPLRPLRDGNKGAAKHTL